MAEVKWIKIVTDLFDDEKILLIESLPSADSIIVIWFKLLCLAGKNNNSGVFVMNDKIPYTEEMLSTIFRRDLNTVRLALTTFENFGMIEIMNNVITIPNWSKHQNLDQLEERKEYMKDYMKKYREKQKLLADGECKVNSKVNSKANVNPLEEEREEERDIDIEEDKNIKKEKKKSEFDVIIQNYTDNEEFQRVIYEFVKMRKAIKAPMTSNALKLMLKKLDKLETDVYLKVDILEQSIMNSWKGIFPLKKEGDSYGHNTSSTGESKKWNYSITGCELTDEERRRAEEELL